MKVSDLGKQSVIPPKQENTQEVSPTQKESPQGTGRAALAQQSAENTSESSIYCVNQLGTSLDQTRASQTLENKQPLNDPAGFGGGSSNISQPKSALKMKLAGLKPLTIPNMPTKAEIKAELGIKPPTQEQLYELTNAIKNTVNTDFAVTGGFALELHAKKNNTPAHRMVNDVDIIAKDYLTFLMDLSKNSDFDTSHASRGEDNGWVIHKPTNQVFDVLQANYRFGHMEQVETINGLPVESLSSLSTKLQTMTGKDAPDTLVVGLGEKDGLEKRQSDLAFINTLRSE